ncbi:MAG: hypothetical protein ACOYXU_08275 [Nitrospirota bacterium]
MRPIVGATTRRGGFGRVSRLLVGLVAVVFVGACTSARQAASVVVHDQLPAGAAKGYIEFYCSDCLSNFSISQVENDKETLITKFMIGKTVGAAAQSTDRGLRMKRVRIAQPPGDREYMVTSASPVFKGFPQRFSVSTVQGHLTPIRIDFIRHTSVSLDWKAVVGSPLPLTADPEGIAVLSAALSTADWGMRWYAAEVLLMSGQQITGDSALGQRLRDLSGEDAYKQCLSQADVSACSLVRDQATRTLAVIEGEGP